MCSVHLLRRRKLLTALTRGFDDPSRVGSLFASYRATAALRFPEDGGGRGADHVAKRQRWVSKKPGAQPKPGASDWGRDRERSARSRAWGDETPAPQRQSHGRGHESALSNELRKLILEDFPQEREAPGRRSTADAGEERHEVLFGIAPCLLALAQGRRKVSKLFVLDGEAPPRPTVVNVCEEARRRGVPVLRVSKAILERMCSGGVHQGVCLQASPLGYLTESSDSASRREDGGTPLWLVLERIQDPMNLGAILRTAYFLGVDRVASSVGHTCPLSPVVSKASSGVMEVLGVHGYENLDDMVRSKAAQGWQVVGTVGAEAEASGLHVTQCSDFKMTKPTLLLMGSEGGGLSKQLLSLCQTHLTVPPGRELLPGIESLNVSVATGILLHSLLFSRRSSRD